MIAKDSQRNEKIIAYRGQANCAAYARLLAQCLDKPVQVLCQSRWQHICFPHVVFPVDDDGEVTRAYIGHRYPANWDLEEKWCQNLRLRAGGTGGWSG